MGQEIEMNDTWGLPQVDEALCTLCGLCIEACPCGAVEMGGSGPLFACPETDGCWCLCEEVCPNDAITCAFEIVLE